MQKRSFLYLFCALCAITIPFSVQAEVQITNAGGWYESAYVEWTPEEGVSEYIVQVQRVEEAIYTMTFDIDETLIRAYNGYYRADVLGLAPGNYSLSIFPKIIDEPGMESGVPPLATTELLTVKAHDRNGFAHFNYPNGVGAYKNDGTLKDGAKVLYVHAGNVGTVEMDITIDKNGNKRHCVGLQHIITAYEKGFANQPLDIRIIGTIDANQLDSMGSKEEGLQVKGKVGGPMEITIEGVGNDAVIRGFGILARQAESLELRNFAVMTALDDCISLDTKNCHVWVHHIDGFYSRPGSASDQKKGDGTIDVKGNSQYVTISSNHFWDTGKSSMCGMKQDTMPNYITYHHNWFDHSDSRHPRIRRMSVHIYNNYFDGNAKYCVGITNGGSAFVENNYFRNCPKPMLISMQGTDTKNGTDTKDAPTFSGEDGGIIKAYNNIFTGSKTLVYYNATSAPVHFDAYLASTRDEQVPASVKALQGESVYDNFDTNGSLMPSIEPDAAEDVPSIVTGEGGAGRMQHGDVSFTFTSADDSSSDLNIALSQLIAGYQSSLVAIQGEDYNQQGVTQTSEDTDLHFDGETIYNPLGKVIRIYTISGACIGTTSSQNVHTDYLPAGIYLVVSKEGSLRIIK